MTQNTFAITLSIIAVAGYTGLFLFSEYRSFRRGQDAWFWPTPVGQWLFRALRLSGKSRFSGKE